MNFSRYFTRGLNNTLKVLNGLNFSYKGPWVTVGTNTVVDEWYVGDFNGADYTLSIDHDNGEKELIRCLLVAGPEKANVVIYGRVNLNGNLITLTATVTNSKVQLIANPARPLTGPGSKVIFSANYYQTLNDLQR